MGNIQESQNEKATLIERLFILIFSASKQELAIALLLVSLCGHIVTLKIAFDAKSENAVMQEEFRKEMYDIINFEVKKQIIPIKKTVDNAADEIGETLTEIKNEKSK